MNISLRPFTMQDLPRYKRWREDIHTSQYMSRFYPHAFNGDSHAFSNLYRWYIILANGEQVGTIWLEKEHIKDEVASLGILVGAQDRLGRGIGRHAIPLAIKEARVDLGFQAVQLHVRVQNPRAIACYKHCGFLTGSEGHKKTGYGAEVQFLEMLHYL